MPEPHKIQLSATNVPPAKAPDLVAYYRLKADECLQRAERDANDRDYWTGLANTWTRLAMIPERLTLR